MLGAVKWGAYKLDRLFEIENAPSFNTDMLVEGDEYDYITRTSTNQGIFDTTGFINEDNINPAGVWSLGLLQMDFFYRNKPWYAGQFMKRVTPKIHIPKEAVQYFTTVLNKQKTTLLSVLVRNVEKVFRSIVVYLPVSQDGSIDFDFIESFIAEIKSDRVKALSEYINAKELESYDLTSAENDALTAFANETIIMKDFAIGDLFDVKSSKKKFDANKVSMVEQGGYPYVVRLSNNNGQKGRIAEDVRYLNEGNTISFGQDTATIYYQSDPYFTGDKIKILKPKETLFRRSNALFFISAMNKVFSSFSWGTQSFSVPVLEQQRIWLPTKNNQIDYSYIELLSSGVEKLILENIVAYVENENRLLSTRGKVRNQ